MFNNILENGTFTMTNGIIAILVGILCGVVIAFINSKTTESTKNFNNTLVILPLLVSIAIILVNGNLGVGVAIMGVFGLVRFRSMPGTSKEIMSVFFAMVVGLSIGTGYIVLSLILTILVSLILVILSKINLLDKNNIKELKIIVPEDVDFTKEFDKIFDKYLNKYSIDKLKTTNMGSLYEITYKINLKDNVNEKEFIDELRVINGNLKIMIYKLSEDSEL